MNTQCLIQTSTDPYFNLAAEEYFLKNFQDDFFILWRSEASVVVGKHQNALAEINHEYVRKHQIPVARRLSGGGTVFHDPGNVNFTFIRNVNAISEVNFKVFTVPVISALKKLGVEASTSGRNDLLIDGKKISGNAEHVHKNRVLHHGTLLFDSRLEVLKGALNVDLSKYEDKAVQSKRSEVANIVDYLKNKISAEQFTRFLFDEIGHSLPEIRMYQTTDEDINAIEKLRDEKYQSWDWIFGYSPRFTYSNELSFQGGKIALKLLVERGRIIESEISGAISAELKQDVSHGIIGYRHMLEELKMAVLPFNARLTAERIEEDKFLSLFF
jgi:lipoate-protein ligase A